MSRKIIPPSTILVACAFAASCKPPVEGDAALAASEPLLSEATDSASTSVRGLAQLRALTGSAVPTSPSCNDGSGNNAACCVLVHGYTDHGDGGGGIFCYKPNSTASDDGGTVIQPYGSLPGSAGRWHRHADTALSVAWFGARCDGVTDDTAAFKDAIKVANQRGGTILLPRAKTCLVRQLDLGQASPGAADPRAGGITFKGSSALTHSSGASSSTILLQPSAASAAACTVLTDTPANASSGGGIAIPTNVNNVTFEDLELKAGANLNSCLVNVSTTTAFGDPYRITFRRVHFHGNGTTAASAFLSRSSWLTFDHCLFTGSVRAIKEDFSTGDSYSTNPYIVDNLFYRAVQGVLGTLPLVELWDVAGGQIAGNNFENGPYGMYIGQMAGGSITGNWFNGENENVSAGEWINVGCSGCSVDGNHLEAGFDGIVVRGDGGRVSANYFIGQRGTPLRAMGNNLTAHGNYFHGGTATNGNQTALSVSAGSGHQIGTNYFFSGANRLTLYSVALGAGTRGTLVHASASDLTTGGILDGSGGAWEVRVDQASRTDATNTTVYKLKRVNTGSDGATLNLENDSGRNNRLVINDTVAGGAYGGLEINKAGTRTVNIAGGGLSGPTYFNAGDNFGIGTAAPAQKLEVKGGNAYLSSSGSGLVLKSPSGTVCRRVAIDDTGALVTAAIACP